MSWFSATVRVACVIEQVGLDRYMDSLHVFQAADFTSAFQRALEIGGRHEETYRNHDEQLVVWRLASIVSLDQIGDELTDGVEVYSAPVDVVDADRLPFEHVFTPERSSPTQTI